MSNTGTYKLIGGTMVKVSDKVPSLRKPVWFPPRSQVGVSGYKDEHLGHNVILENKDQKREYMRKNHVAEAG